MHHTDSSIKIHYTKDYSLFKNIAGNRDLNFPKIDRIINDIDSGIDLLRYCPILVVERQNLLEIVDGQHRFYVAKEIGSKVWYIIAEELSLYDIARLNSNTEKWNAKDFINCYTQLGNPHYKALKTFLLKYNSIPVTTAISLLVDGKVNSGGSHSKTDFEQGKFEIKFQSKAEAFMDMVHQFKCISKSKYPRPFLLAIEKISLAKKIDIAELIEKANNEDASLKYLETEKQYLTALEEIMNKGKHKRIVIY